MPVDIEFGISLGFGEQELADVLHRIGKEREQDDLTLLRFVVGADRLLGRLGCDLFQLAHQRLEFRVMFGGDMPRALGQALQNREIGRDGPM